MSQKDYQISAINKNVINNNVTITLYKEDYTEISWEMILRDLNIEFHHNTNNNLKSITLEIAKVTDLENDIY